MGNGSGHRGEGKKNIKVSADSLKRHIPGVCVIGVFRGNAAKCNCGKITKHYTGFDIVSDDLKQATCLDKACFEKSSSHVMQTVAAMAPKLRETLRSFASR
jgi:hypothetical protein